MPHEMGGRNTRRFGRLAEAIEVVVVEEQLGDEEVGAGILLRAQMTNVLARVEAIDMPFRISRRAHAQAGRFQARDELVGIAKIGRLLAGRKIAAQSEHRFNPCRAQGFHFRRHQ